MGRDGGAPADGVPCEVVPGADVLPPGQGNLASSDSCDSRSWDMLSHRLELASWRCPGNLGFEAVC